MDGMCLVVLLGCLIKEHLPLQDIFNVLSLLSLIGMEYFRNIKVP